MLCHDSSYQTISKPNACTDPTLKGHGIMIYSSITPQFAMKVKVDDIGWSFVLGITFGFAEDTDSDNAEDTVVFHTTWGHVYQDDVSKYQVLLGNKWTTKDELDEPS
jgi:hypothetical protein